MHENEIGTIVVDEAIHLHQALGPGLLETVYGTLQRRLSRRHRDHGEENASKEPLFRNWVKSNICSKKNDFPRHAGLGGPLDRNECTWTPSFDVPDEGKSSFGGVVFWIFRRTKPFSPDGI
jgi:hypothetical protein